MSNILGLNVGGLNVSYDLGPSTDTVASQAYSFLNTSFASDAALLTNATTGAQSLVSSVTKPVIDMATSQQQFNDTILPGMFQTVESDNYSIAGQALDTQAMTAQASIASSNAQAARAPSGGCFVTTAMCEVFAMPDDCETLQVMRRFRDTHLAPTNVGRSYIREYQHSAPALAAALVKRSDRADICRYLHESFMLPAMACIERGENSKAFRHYRRMVYALKGILQWT